MTTRFRNAILRVCADELFEANLPATEVWPLVNRIADFAHQELEEALIQNHHRPRFPALAQCGLKPGE